MEFIGLSAIALGATMILCGVGEPGNPPRPAVGYFFLALVFIGGIFGLPEVLSWFGVYR